MEPIELKPNTFHNAIRILARDYDKYVFTKHMDLHIGSLIAKAAENPTIPGGSFIIDWYTYKNMYIILMPEHFKFSTYNHSTFRWADDALISYDIERGEFDQLQFCHEMYTLKYKDIKYLTQIKDKHYGTKQPK